MKHRYVCLCKQSSVGMFSIDSYLCVYVGEGLLEVREKSVSRDICVFVMRSSVDMGVCMSSLRKWTATYVCIYVQLYMYIYTA